MKILRRRHVVSSFCVKVYEQSNEHIISLLQNSTCPDMMISIVRVATVGWAQQTWSADLQYLFNAFYYFLILTLYRNLRHLHCKASTK